MSGPQATAGEALGEVISALDYINAARISAEKSGVTPSQFRAAMAHRLSYELLSAEIPQTCGRPLADESPPML